VNHQCLFGSPIRLRWDAGSEWQLVRAIVASMPDGATLRKRAATMWRFAEALPVPHPGALSMGEGMTPLVVAPGRSAAFKVDYLMPTGSFKDRGTVVLIAAALQAGARRVVADSSGNAGTAIAAYAARARIGCEVYVPAATSSAKLSQLAAYGATVREVAGSREQTAAAAAEAASDPGVFYASHVYNPFFFHGTKTYVLELWEQCGGRLPATLVLPVGNGTLLLGVYLGCRELLAQDLMPRLVAVQASACAPLARAWADGSAHPAEVAGLDTIAEGVAIARPVRGAQILAAIAATQGTVVSVSDEQILGAYRDLAAAGLYVEPTSAVCWAALLAGLVDLEPDSAHERVVLPLCGSGLKTKPYFDGAVS